MTFSEGKGRGPIHKGPNKARPVTNFFFSFFSPLRGTAS